MRWFGEPWPSADRRAPVCEDDAWRVDVPVGGVCLMCSEPVEAGDRGMLMLFVRVKSAEMAPVHAECQLRSSTGNHLHLRGMCTHIGSCNEMSGLSYRDEAREVWRMLVDDC